VSFDFHRRYDSVQWIWPLFNIDQTRRRSENVVAALNGADESLVDCVFCQYRGAAVGVYSPIYHAGTLVGHN
jgi:hypothetical protein